MKPDLYCYQQNKGLVLDVINAVRFHDGPISWSDLTGDFTAGQTASVTRIINHLCAFGAFQKVGKFTPRKDTRAYVLTDLGHAWLSRECPPLVDDDDDEIEAFFSDDDD